MNYRWYLQHCVYSVRLIESMAGFTELWRWFELKRAPRSRVEIGQILPAAIWRGHRPAHIRLLRCRWPFRPAAASSEPLFKSRHGVWEYPCCPRGFYHPLLAENPVPAWTAAGRNRMLPPAATDRNRLIPWPAKQNRLTKQTLNCKVNPGSMPISS